MTHDKKGKKTKSPKTEYMLFEGDNLKLPVMLSGFPTPDVNTFMPACNKTEFDRMTHNIILILNDKY